MRRPAIVRAAASAVLGSLLLAGCTATPEPEGPPTLAIVMPALEGRFQDVADVLEQRAEDAGYEVEVHGTDGDIPAQVTTVSELLDERVDALVVWPIDGTSLTPVVDDAPLGTTIVAIGGLIRDTARLDAYVAFDPAASGTAQVEVLNEALPPGDRPLRIELFVGSPDNAATEPHHRAITLALQPRLDAESIVIGSGQLALDDVTTLRGNAETAQSRMARILRESYADGLPDAVIATSDEIARGVSAALVEAGAVPGDGFPLITGRGSELASLVALLEGRQFSTQLEDPRALAEAAADVVLAAADGTGVLTVDNGAAQIDAWLVPGVTVRADQIDELVIGSGYWSRERLDEAIAEYGTGSP